MGICQEFATFFSIGADQSYNHWDGWFNFIKGSQNTFCDFVASGDSPENVEQDGLDILVGKDIILPGSKEKRR